MSSLKQSLHLKQQQRLSPQQIQVLKLLQIPVGMLEQRIKEELQENPALEEGEEEQEDETNNEEEEDFSNEDETDAEKKEREKDDDVNVEDYITDEDLPYYKTQTNNSSADDERREIPMASSVSFEEQLHAQLYQCDLDDHEYRIADHLLGSLDDDGYLRRELSSLVDDLAFTQNITTTAEELEKILKAIQTLEPPGVGARTLQECLLLQLKRKDQNDTNVALAEKIISEYMEEFSRKHYDKIAEALEMDLDSLKEVMDEILKLNPRPGNSSAEGTRSSQQVIPDFIITNNDGTLELALNSRNSPELKLSSDYKEMLDQYSKNKKKNSGNKEAVHFVKGKLEAARLFIDALREREITLLHVMNSIMSYQYEFFIDGDQKKLRPMILKDIADIVGLDISTISRVSNSKYVQTPFGTYLLKSFFSEGMQTTGGEEVSSKEVKQILSDSIGAEDKRNPLTDDELAKVLKEKGYSIARRTVAKYREQLNIPIARLRKEL